MSPDGVVQAASKSILQRPGQPEELAPAYVLLASSDGSYITGSLLDINRWKCLAALLQRYTIEVCWLIKFVLVDNQRFSNHSVSQSLFCL